MVEKKLKIKTPPNSKESEMMVLGSMLTNFNSLNIAIDGLEETDFYYQEHRIIFKSIKELYKKDKPADIHIVAEELKNIEKLKEVGDINYLTTLAQYAGTSVYVEEYINLIKEKSILRQMIDVSNEIIKFSLKSPKDVYQILDEAQSKYFNISQKSNRKYGVLVKELLSGVSSESKLPFLKELQERQENYQKKGPEASKIIGVASHFTDLDKLINGMTASNLIILASRPAMGKTALALNISENISLKSSLPVGIFSLEMTAEQLLHRIICSQSEVESDKIKTGSLNGLEYQNIVSTVNILKNHNIVIDDYPGLKITDIRARARRMKEVYDVKFLVIDYLQLISGSGTMKSSESRQIEISEISRMLKNLARELNIPILCLSQLSRKVEERQGHRPIMSDLRESGCLAGDTLIKDYQNEKLYTIEELAKRKIQKPIYTYSVDKNFKLKKQKFIKFFSSGKKLTYLLKTKSKSIKASSNHPFLKKEGWVNLEQLKVKDKIATFKLQNIYWEEIISIQELKEEEVYDATVENLHNFIANDIIVHNSIEQDADLIMFIFRNEYYDPYDKPGYAELIVAKNRHGRVGSVNLTFRKEIAQFSNYSEKEYFVEN